MKRKTGLVLIMCLMLPLLCHGAGELELITEELPPFNYTDEGQLTGVTVSVVREILRRLGIEDTIAVMPWARGYQRLCSGPNVVLFTTARTPERENLFHWVGPLYFSRLAFYARQSDPISIDSLDDAKRVKAIATYNQDSGEQILKSIGFRNLDSSNNPQSNLRKLVSGRVDLWFFHNMGAPHVAREAGIDPDAIRPVYTYREYVSFIAISKQTAASVVERWQTTLDQIKADGTFWWLARKWLPADAMAVSPRQTSFPDDGALKLYTEDSPPSAFMSDKRLTGLSVDVVREILRRIGKPDTISMVPWARGYQNALNDAGTALFATTRIPQREPLFAWVGPLYRQHWGFYRWRGSSVAIHDIADAKGVQRIGTYHKDAKMQYLQGLGFENLVPTNKNVNNIRHLKRGYVDLWASSDFNLAHLAQQADVAAEDLELAHAFHTVYNYIAFSKATSPHTIRLWQAVLDEMKTDGSYRRICRQYGYNP